MRRSVGNALFAALMAIDCMSDVSLAFYDAIVRVVVHDVRDQRLQRQAFCQRDAVQGGFAWLDSGKRLRLDLANPVGSTLARIDVTPARAVVTRSDGSTEQAADADGLVEMALGSPLPVSGLRDWLRGRTGQGGQVSNLEKNSQGQITGFTQDGWRVRLSRYDDQGPGLVQLNRDDSSRSISARLVIDG